jgi:hypothetical protein
MIFDTSFIFCDTLTGRTSGSSVDWVYENIDGIVYSFGTELRDQGFYGFELPAEQIIPSGEENYAAIIQLLTTIRNDNP